MTNTNLSEGLEKLELISNELNARAAIILDRLIGPRPAEGENSGPTPGAMGTLDRVTGALARLCGQVAILEEVVGASAPTSLHAAAQCQAPAGLGKHHRN